MLPDGTEALPPAAAAAAAMVELRRICSLSTKAVSARWVAGDGSR
jgi:hypothetical protein